MKSVYKVLIIGIIIVAVACSVKFFSLHELFSVKTMKNNTVVLHGFIQRHYAASVIIFIMTCFITTLIGLPTLVPLGLLAGALFSFKEGFLYLIFGCLMGAASYFLLTRYFFSEVIRTKYGARLKRIQDKMHEYGGWYLLTLHYISIVPFFVINSVAAFSGVSLAFFMMITTLGCIPLGAVSVLAGKEIAHLQSASDILKPSIIYLLCALAVCAFLPILLRRYIHVKRER